MTDDALRDVLVDRFYNHQWDLRESTDFYTGAYRPTAVGVSIPPQMRQLLASVGYPRLYVDTLAERLEVEGFRLGGDESDDMLWHWWQVNDLDLESTLGHTDASRPRLHHGVIPAVRGRSPHQGGAGHRPTRQH